MAELRSLDFDLEAVTPIMAGGAYRQAEVRPPSFRGVARFWLRALVGGILGQDLAQLRHVEGAVFGTPRRSSLVAVRATGEPVVAELPVDRRDFPGVSYMLYSAFQSRRDAVLPEERFRLRLQTRPVELPEIEIRDQQVDIALAWRLAAVSLWLTVHLGGVGHRMRRGGGGLRFVAEPAEWPEGLPPTLIQATTPQELAEELGKHLTNLRRALGWSPATVLPTPAPFDILHPDTCELYILDQTYPTWYHALDAVGQTFRAFRSREPHDYENVKEILTRSRTAIDGVKRAVFGLPLMFFFGSLYRELVDQSVPTREARMRASAMLVPRRGMGRASPLWFRVLRLAGDKPAPQQPVEAAQDKTQDGVYTIQITLFRSEFLEDGMMTLRPRDRSIAPIDVEAPVDFSFIEEWFDHLGQTVAPLLPVTFE